MDYCADVVSVSLLMRILMLKRETFIDSKDLNFRLLLSFTNEVVGVISHFCCQESVAFSLQTIHLGQR